MSFKRVAKEPMVHFLCLSLVMVAVHSVWFHSSDDSADGRTIVVDEQRLLQHLQFRSKAFSNEIFSAQLAAMTDVEREQLVQEYVSEEALYREAKLMGLDYNDYIIRRRLVQKVEYLARGLSSNDIEISASALEDFYTEHRDDYLIPAKRSFSHVFFSADSADSKQQASELLAKVVSGDMQFEEIAKQGHRFPYHKHYIDRDEGAVRGHFGASFAQSLFALEGVDTVLLESPFGYHIVKLIAVNPAVEPVWDDVAERVQEDYRRSLLARAQADAITEIVDQYRVDFKLPAANAALLGK